jgi:hypothetical protein
VACAFVKQTAKEKKNEELNLLLPTNKVSNLIHTCKIYAKYCERLRSSTFNGSRFSRSITAYPYWKTKTYLREESNLETR